MTKRKFGFHAWYGRHALSTCIRRPKTKSRFQIWSSHSLKRTDKTYHWTQKNWNSLQYPIIESARRPVPECNEILIPVCGEIPKISPMISPLLKKISVCGYWWFPSSFTRGAKWSNLLSQLVEEVCQKVSFSSIVLEKVKGWHFWRPSVSVSSLEIKILKIQCTKWNWKREILYFCIL